MAARILIADDYDFARRQLRELLEKHPGWEICAAVANGQEAVSKAEQMKPDLIILDLAMPVMNGLHAAQKILKVLPQVPIVIYSLHASREIELEAEHSGVRRVLSKAGDTESLIHAIEGLLQHEQPAVRSVPSGGASAAAVCTAGASAPTSQPETSELAPTRQACVDTSSETH